MFNYFFKPLLVYLSSDRRFLQTLKRLFGFYPGNTSLYKLAFKHKSYGDGSNKDLHPTAIGSNNERLEYLGDAVLGAIIANYLFLRFPYKDEGFLTEMRSMIVNRQHLSGLRMRQPGKGREIQMDGQALLGLIQFNVADIPRGSLETQGQSKNAFLIHGPILPNSPLVENPAKKRKPRRWAWGPGARHSPIRKA